MTTPVERSLKTDWGQLSALHWSNPEGIPVLCVHGWMDNAASFAPLAPLLEGCDLVSLDLAGHGESDHRPDGCQYHFTDNLYDLDQVLDQLGWDQAVLMGHSLGSSLVGCFAAAAPERVRQLVMLDSVGPLSAPADGVPNQLKKSLSSVRKPRSLERTYETVEDAARSRIRKMKMSMESANLLAKRSLKGKPGAWQWKTDPRLMWTSPWRMTEEQAIAILSGIECAVLLVSSPMMREFMGDEFEQRLASIDEVEYLDVEGTHHVHMDQPELLAPSINPFINHCGDPR